MNQHDVIVIGGGPAGSRVAQKLAQMQYNVAVMEKSRQIGNKPSCTGIIGRECFETFGIDRSCVLAESKSAKLFAPSGEYLRIEKDITQAYIVDRVAFDRLLARRAEEAGAQYFFSCQVTDVSVTPNEVHVIAEDGAYKTSFRGRAVVIANGFGSNLPEMLGMGRVKRFIMGAQTEVKIKHVDEVEVYFGRKTAPGFFAWVVPTSDGFARIGLFSKERPANYLRRFMAMLEAQGKIATNNTPIYHGGVPLRSLPRTYADRVLVVGDAAGQVKPTTGGGIYYGLLCADFAADALEHALEAGDLSHRRLSLYERSWKARLSWELKTGYFARQLYTRLSDKRLNKIFRIVQENHIHESLLNSSYNSFDWHGKLIFDGLKYLGPWRHLFGKFYSNDRLTAFRGDL